MNDYRGYATTSIYKKIVVNDEEYVVIIVDDDYGIYCEYLIVVCRESISQRNAAWMLQWSEEPNAYAIDNTSYDGYVPQDLVDPIAAIFEECFCKKLPNEFRI